jgi:lipid II:glycine glycyltransferase (peptidoglycan interpeptide bridge formation enzyme)
VDPDAAGGQGVISVGVALLYASERAPSATDLTVREISAAAHLRFVQNAARTGTVSFLQCPSWGGAKAGWRAESIGWFAGPRLAGAALVLYRRLPRLRRSFAYLPEGPVLDWFRGPDPAAAAPARWLDPIVDHLRGRGAFSVKIGPRVARRGWSADTIKRALAVPGAAVRLADLPPDWQDPQAAALAEALAGLGWRGPAARSSPGPGQGGAARQEGAGFGDFQPRLQFRLPLAGRGEEDLLAGMNQQWRRNIRVARRHGVDVVRGTAADLPAFHRLYRETAARDRFVPRPLDYFERMFGALTAEDADRIRLYLAVRDGVPLAGATMVRVGSYAWYSYGASSDHGREARPSNAVQWRMMQDCLADRAEVYDLRGIGGTLDPEHHLFGLLRFKLGLGGEAVEYLGEWDYPINRALHGSFESYLAFRAYLARRKPCR